MSEVLPPSPASSASSAAPLPASPASPGVAAAPSLLPTGTVTFLFTDIEGSTKLLNAHPDNYKRAVRRHHDLLLEAVHLADGAVFETVGDAVYAAFARPTDAAKAALRAQLMLHEEEWGATPIKVRMGIHLGEAEVQGEHYFGAPLYRCARLMATAHGGQIVVSEVVAAAIRGSLPSGASLLDLGEHRLKDLAHAERVCQLVAPGLPAAFPPLRSLDTLPNNLPVQLTRFIGREDALAEVKQLLAGARLLTLSGTGGSGKTRLALQAAADLVESYADGVWFVDLAPLADASLIAVTALSALGALGEQDLSGVPPETRLVEYLRGKSALLILDNCEHVIEACARLAETLVRQCPGVRLLATSRELLGVRGESAWRVPSLTLPDPAAELTAIELDQYEAVRLFIDRALAVQPSFQVTNENAPAVAQICHRLDGIPLAIELAAARVRVLSVEQIAARLNDRFRLLTGGGRTALRRQQTLQALVDWSHDLLSEPERALFRRLAVFAGGFTLEAAEAVCAAEPVESYEVLDLLTGLCDKSLVLSETRGAAQRYRLLETMRQYAEDKLLAAGEASDVRDRHAQWCEDLTRAFKDADDAHDAARLRATASAWVAERDNVRAALAWCASSPEAAPLGLRLLALAGMGGGRGLLGALASDARRWLETFLRLLPERTAERAECLLTLDHFLRWQHEFRLAGAAAREAREIYEALDDADRARKAGVHEGLVAANLGDYDRAVSLIEPALTWARERGDAIAIEQFTRDLGVIAISRRDLVVARAFMEETFALAERHGLPIHVSHLHVRLAIIDRLSGDVGRARERLAQALRHSQPRLAGMGRIGLDDLVEVTLASCARDEGRFDEAATYMQRVIRSARQRGDGGMLLGAVCMAGALEIARGEHARGVTIIAACDTGEGPVGTIHMPEVRADMPLFLERARAALGEAAYEAAWAKGRALGLQDAARLVLGESSATR